MTADLVYGVAMALNKRDEIEVCTVPGLREAGGVRIGRTVVPDGEHWHDSLWAARVEAADRMQRISDRAAEQARRMREAT